MLTVAGISKPRLWLELALIFVALPLLCWWCKLPVIVVLLAACAFVVVVIARDPQFDRRCFTMISSGAKIWQHIFLVWGCAMPVLVGLVWFLQPDLLFDFPRQKTTLWLIVMVAYPLISVVPQEIIYRAFFCHRYTPLFGSGAAMALASAMAFGFAHIVFGNVIAVVLTLAGGWLFARTFQRTRSIPCVAVQHALFGGTIFTVGLGQYFFQGTTKFVETLLNHSSH